MNDSAEPAVMRRILVATISCAFASRCFQRGYDVGLLDHEHAVVGQAFDTGREQRPFRGLVDQIQDVDDHDRIPLALGQRARLEVAEREVHIGVIGVRLGVRRHRDLAGIDVDARHLAIGGRHREVGAHETMAATDLEHASTARHLGVDDRDRTRAKPTAHVQPVALWRVIEQRQHSRVEIGRHGSALGDGEVAIGAESQAVTLDRLAHGR